VKLQLEDITSLKTAAQRAMAMKVIQENNVFRIKKGQREKFKFRAEKMENSLERSKVGERKEGQGRNIVE